MTTTFDAGRISGSLAMFASLPDWLAAAMQPDTVADSLARHVPELSDGRLALVECRPQRLRAKGSDWLARYEVWVAEPAGDPRTVVLVGALHPPSDPLPGAGTAHERPFGSPGWVCVLPDVRLELHAQATDEALPALPTLVQAEPVVRLLESVLRGAGYDGARIAAADPKVVRYKPGSRCTVVVGLRYASGCTGPAPVVVKTHQGDKGESAWAAMTALWRRSESWRHAVRLAEPLGYLPEQRVLVQGPVPEELTLKELARRAIGSRSPADLERLRDELTATARALAALHGSGASYSRTADFEGELTEVQEVVRRLSLSIPGLGDAAAPLLQSLQGASVSAPPDCPVPAHHDFRPAQVLLAAGGVGFIDFDGASMAEPALDLGRFRAKLRDIGISTLGADRKPPSGERAQPVLRLLDDLCDHFLEAYLEDAQVSAARVVLWETCDLFTALLHAWTKVRIPRVRPRLTVLEHQLRTRLGD